MDNPETLVTLLTKHRAITNKTHKIHNSTQRTKKMSNTNLTKDRGVPRFS
jgi:hypothetical protein